MIDKAIKHELYLSLYNDWGPGRYRSSRGIMVISEMNTTHLKNAINDLAVKRVAKQMAVMKIDEESDFISDIKATYLAGQDLIALKIAELTAELKSRDL